MRNHRHLWLAGLLWLLSGWAVAQNPSPTASSDFALSVLSPELRGEDSLRVMVAVSNQGPDDASGVLVTLETSLPPGTQWDVVDIETGSELQGIFWLVERLPVNDSAVLTLDFQHQDPAQLNQIQLTARITDADQIIINGSDDVASLTANGDATDTGTLSLSPEDPVLPSGTQWERYRGIKLVASGGTPPLRIQLRGIPPGLGSLGLDGSLTLAGMPREAGEFILRVTVRDAADPPASLTREYQLEISEGIAPPPPMPPATTEQQPSLPLPEAPVDGEAPDSEAEAPINPETGNGDSPPSDTPQPVDNSTGASNTSGSGGLDNLNPSTPTSSDLGNATTATPASADTAATASDEATPVADDAATTVADTSASDDATVIDTGVSTGGGSTLGFRASLPSATVGNPFDAEVLSGLTEDAQMSLQQGLLPPGLRVSGTKLQGIPQQAGEYPFGLEGTRSSERVQRTYSLTVARGSLGIPPQSLPTPAVEHPYRVRLQALGGQAPYRWEATTLPSSLSLSATGLLSGSLVSRTPQTLNVTVRDARNRVARTTLTLAGAVNAPVAGGFQLPDLLQQERYTLPLPISGNNPPFRCQVDSGALPPGLRLNADCQLTGSPSQAGDYRFVLRFSDASALERSSTLPLALRVSSRDGVDGGIPFRQIHSPLLPEVPQTPGQGQFAALALDPLGERSAVGHGFFASDADLQLARYSADGRFLWSDTVPEPGDDFPSAAAHHPLDRRLWVVGYNRQGGQSRGFIARFSPTGELIEPFQYPFATGESAFYDLVLDQDSIYAAGMQVVEGEVRATVLAFDNNGTLRWERTAGPGVNSAQAITLLDCTAGVCDTVVVGGENGATGWLQRLDANSGEVSDEIAATLPVPVVDLIATGANTLAVASGSATTPLLLLNPNLELRCQADAQRDASLSLITAAPGAYLFLAGQRPSSGAPVLWVYDEQCQAQLEADLDLRDARLLDSQLGLDQRLSLVGARGDQPLLMDLNSGQAF